MWRSGASPDLSGVAQAAQKTEACRYRSVRADIRDEWPVTDRRRGVVHGRWCSRLRPAAHAHDDGPELSRRAARGSDAGDLTFDAVLDGTVFYMRFPLLAGLVGEGKPWLKIDLQKVAKLSGNELGLGVLDKATRHKRSPTCAPQATSTSSARKTSAASPPPTTRGSSIHARRSTSSRVHEGAVGEAARRKLMWPDPG